jgi:hypothetical protein
LRVTVSFSEKKKAKKEDVGVSFKQPRLLKAQFHKLLMNIFITQRLYFSHLLPISPCQNCPFQYFH